MKIEQQLVHSNQTVLIYGISILAFFSLLFGGPTIRLPREPCKKRYGQQAPYTCKDRKSVSVGSVRVLDEPWLEVLAYCVQLFLRQRNFSEVRVCVRLFPKQRAIFYFITAIGRLFSENRIRIREI